MPRGQYDRSAAKAKRTDAQLTHMMDTHLRVADVQQPAPHYTRPGFPYENSPEPMTGVDDLKVRLAVAEALNAKYAALLKRNGLWLDE